MQFRYTALISFLSLLAVGFLWSTPFLLTLVLLLLSVVLLFPFQKTDSILYISCFVAGALSEMLAVYLGAWVYSSSQLFGVPLWLFFLWGIAGIFVYRAGKKVEELFGK